MAPRNPTAQTQTARCDIHAGEAAGDVVTMALAGNWKLGQDRPEASSVTKQIDDYPGLKRLVFDARELSDWDTGLITFLVVVATHAASAACMSQRAVCVWAVADLTTW